jgi:hypothetical protein
MFEGKASQLYINNTIIQIWSATTEPYVCTGYTRWVRDDPYPIKVFQKPVAKSLLFAGDALPVDLESWGYCNTCTVRHSQVNKVSRHICSA